MLSREGAIGGLRDSLLYEGRCWIVATFGLAGDGPLENVNA